MGSGTKDGGRTSITTATLDRISGGPASMPCGTTGLAAARSAAMETLGCSDVIGAHVPMVTALIRDSEPSVRAAAAWALGRAGGVLPEQRTASIVALSVLIKDPMSGPRAAAAEALGMLGDSSSAPKIAELLHTDGSDEVQVATVTALRYLGAGGAEYHSQVAAILGAPEATTAVRRAAAEALSIMGEFVDKAAAASYAKVLAGYLQDGHLPLRKAAVIAMGVLGRVSPDDFLHADDIAKLLCDASMEVRNAAAQTLSYLGEAGAKAVAVILKNASMGGSKKDGEANSGCTSQAFCKAAAQALGLGGEVGAAEAASLLRDEALSVLAAEALGVAGSNAVSCVDDLIGVLRERSANWEARQAAAEALGRIGSPAASALADAIRHGDASCRNIAGKALVYMGGCSAAEEAATLLCDGNSAVRATAASVLGELGCTDQKFADQIAGLLDDCDSDVLCIATRSMAVFGANGAAHASMLVELLHHEEARVRSTAAETLGTIGLGSETAKGLAALETALESDSVAEVRAAAAWALGIFWASDSRDASMVKFKFVACLSDKAGIVRAAATSALVRKGEIGAKELNRNHTIFSDSDAVVRCAAAAALKFEAVDATLHSSMLLRDSDASVRAAAIKGFSERGDKSHAAASKIATLIQDREAAIRVAACHALQKMNPAGVKAPALAQLLKDRDRNVKEAAAHALAVHGFEGAMSVSPYLEDADPEVRSGAALVLGRIGEDSAPFAEALLLCLKDSDCHVRASCRWALQQLGNTVIKSVTELLGHPDAVVRDEAVQVLAGMADEGAAAAAEQLGDHRWEVRQAALEVMCHRGQASAAHAVEISALLFDDTFRVRWSAARALTGLGEIGCAHAASHLKVDNSRPLDLLDSDIAAEHAAALLSNKDPVVRRCAVEALGDSGPPGVAYAAMVADCLEDKDGQVQWAAAEALASMGQDGITHAGEKLRSSNGLARRAAVEVLGMTGELGAKCCAVLMGDAELRIRRLAAEAMGKTGTLAGKENAAALGPLLHDDDRSVRWMAASSLTLMGQTGADLAAKLLDHHAPEVRHACVDVLGRVGWIANIHAEKIAFLCKIDRDHQVRKKAEETLVILSRGGPAGDESCPQGVADWSGAHTDEGKSRMQEIESLLPEVDEQ